MIKVTKTAIDGVLIVEPKVFADDRGFFFESFNHKDFSEAISNDVAFVQDNHSRSVAGVLRGLHYQVPPHAQGKLMRVARGSVFDVAVDIRSASPTFGAWVGLELSEENVKVRLHRARGMVRKNLLEPCEPPTLMVAGNHRQSR